MVLKFLIIFMLVKGGNSRNILANIARESDENLCSKNVQALWKFAWQYFKDRHAVTILAYKDASKDLTSEIVTCGMEASELSVQYNASIWNTSGEKTRRQLNGFDLFYRHEINGLIFITESVENIETIIHKIDPQTKTIIILTNASADDVSNVLKSAWGQHHILDLVVFHNSSSITSIYDPFIIKNNTRGFIHTLKSSKIESILRISQKRLMNVHNYHLGIIDYGRYFDFKQWKLPETQIIRTIVKAKNFRAVLYDSAGYTTHIQQLDEGFADILSITMMPIKYNTQKYSEFLFPAAREEYGFMTPKMRPSYTVSFVKVFDVQISVSLALAYVAMVIARRLFLRKNGSEADFMKICCESFGNLLMVAQPTGNCGGERGRCLFVSWICFSMIVCCCYQGTMVQQLTSGGPSRDICTIHQLAKSELKIIFDFNYRDMIEDIAASEGPPYPYGALLRRPGISKIEFYKSLERNSRDHAMMCDMNECRYQWETCLTSSGEHLIHVLEQGPPGRYLSLMVPIDSPYKAVFDQILMQIVECGLMQKWQSDLKYVRKMRSLKIEHRNRSRSRSRDDVYKMKDLDFIFWSWLGCCTFCFLIFLAELLLCP